MALTRLILIQHAEAVEEEVDVTRPISDKGREDATKMTKYMAGSNLKFTPGGARVDALLHSGKLRAEQTAEIFQANILHHNDHCALGGEKLRVQKMSGMGPNDDVAGVCMCFLVCTTHFQMQYYTYGMDN
jgi:broad specificity phosphatase PhoE